MVSKLKSFESHHHESNTNHKKLFSSVDTCDQLIFYFVLELMCVFCSSLFEFTFSTKLLNLRLLTGFGLLFYSRTYILGNFFVSFTDTFSSIFHRWLWVVLDRNSCRISLLVLMLLTIFTNFIFC